MATTYTTSKAITNSSDASKALANARKALGVGSDVSLTYIVGSDGKRTYSAQYTAAKSDKGSKSTQLKPVSQAAYEKQYSNPTYEPHVTASYDPNWQQKALDQGKDINSPEFNQYREAEKNITTQNYNETLVDQISQQIIALDDQLAQLSPTVMTPEEREQILQKAIAQVQPYYDKKRTEIETGIKEGKIQSAEDILMTIRSVETDTQGLLAKYDLQSAQTDEELAVRLAGITATKDEDIALKTDDYRQKIQTAKQEQVKTGILTSGIGKKDISDILNRKDMEMAAVTRRADQATTEASTVAQHSKEQVVLARQQAEAERVRRIGAPEATATTAAAARTTAGYAPNAALPSDVELLRQRAERNITTYKPTALTDLTEEQKLAEESRRQQLLKEEESIRQQSYQTSYQKILNQMAQKQRELDKVMYSYT